MKTEESREQREKKRMPVFSPLKHHKRSLKGRKSDLLSQSREIKRKKTESERP